MKNSFFLTAMCLTASLSLPGARADTLVQEKETFLKLLKEYKHFNECANILAPEIESIQNIDPAAVARLPDKLLKPRFDRFNVPYKQKSQVEAVVATQLKELQSRLKKTPLSDMKNRGDLELKTVALNARHTEVKRFICMSSVEANKDIQSALLAAPPTEKQLADAPLPAKPKMPGTPNQSRAERLRTKQSDRILLSPVDDEFYKTQLGKKLEKDLGGRADFWSYDYATDDLYVKVNNDIGKLSVREDSPGIRYIRTRVGPSFVEPRGKDTRLDENVKGKFYTKKESDDGLFGPIVKDGPSYVPELPAGHSDHDGHHH